ncbi:glycerophosphoryl diester phosphodiesterase membrane domain-containing protein [Paenibacillus sp. GCM10027626]|uniref:glycerophosphoryl diester phosphodiesterase membrane domain-containing protein n=1 Tax=Paenibacillus sp. GCM10027626 TaxID=3273411 RepID=UPI003644EFF5
MQKTRKTRIFPMMADILKTMLFTFRQLFIFELIYKTMAIFIFLPMISVIFNKLLSMGGFAGATNYELLRFVLSRYGLLSMLILIPLATALIFLEFAVLIIISFYGQHKKKIGIIPAFFQAISYLPSLFKYGFVGWSLYLLLIIPLLSDGIGPSLLPTLEIPNFISGELFKTGQGSLLYFAAFAVIIFFNIRWTFLLHAMVIEGKSGFWEAAKRSAAIQRKSYLKMIMVTMLTMFLYLFVFVIILVILLGLFILLHFTLPQQASYTGFVHSLFSKGVVLSLYLASVVVIPLYMTTLTRLYMTKAKPGDAVLDLADHPADADALPFLKRGLLRKHRRKLIALMLLVALGTSLLLIPAMGEFNMRQEQPIIMAHRGYIAAGAENTLEAIEGAIRAGADFAEIDVLETKDGQLAVIHDTNLKRLTGHNAEVYDMTMDELRKLDVRQGDFVGKISSLPEIMEAARGKIKLNIELKTHGQERNLVPAFLKTLHEQNFMEECIVQSLDYNIVQQVKSAEPGLKVGYIMFAGVPQMEHIKADFVVMEQYLVKKTAVAAAQLHKKEIYVWTVNESEQMEQFFGMGVDGIVTDYPEEAIRLANMQRIENEDDKFWAVFTQWVNGLPK